ncbi:unnamed protein product, partial [marine sediment metagenome]
SQGDNGQEPWNAKRLVWGDGSTAGVMDLFATNGFCSDGWRDD